MAHFCRFNFSLGLKWFILPIFNFHRASNLSFQPFSFFVGAIPSRFSHFSVAKLLLFLSFSAALTRNLHKSIIFYMIFAVRSAEIEEFCVILPSQSERSAKTYCSIDF